MSQLISRLEKFETKKQFADWLWSALVDWHSSKRGRDDLYLFIFRTGAETVVDALAIIYDRHVAADRKILFRAAIGHVLKKCAKSGKPDIAPLVDDLIYLIRQTKATEALDGLLAVMSIKSFMTSNEPQLLYSCLSLLRSLDPSEKVFNSTSRLIQLPFFDEGCLFRAIKVMVECRPESAEKIVDSLGQRITGLYAIVRRGPAEESAYLEAISELFYRKEDALVLSRILSYSV